MSATWLGLLLGFGLGSVGVGGQGGEGRIRGGDFVALDVVFGGSEYCEGAVRVGKPAGLGFEGLNEAHGEEDGLSGRWVCRRSR
jgi:hypothetical protein